MLKVGNWYKPHRTSPVIWEVIQLDEATVVLKLIRGPNGMPKERGEYATVMSSIAEEVLIQIKKPSARNLPDWF